MNWLNTQWLKIKAWFQWLWANHIQKTAGYLIGTLTSMDITGYAEPIKGFVGQRKYYGIVLALAAIVAIRAHVQKKPPP
jgi:hypothetical protein